MRGSLQPREKKQSSRRSSLHSTKVTSLLKTEPATTRIYCAALTMIGSQLHLNIPALFLNVTAVSALITVSVLLCIALLAYAIVTELYRYHVRLPTLSGPPGFPIAGNFYQLAPDPAETLHQWGKRYGGVYQISLGTRPVVVFNSMQAARDVFVGQGHALIDKPRLYTFHSVLSSVASSIGTTAWSESTKRRRKTAASAMNKPAVASFLPFIDELTKALILELLEQGRGGEIAFDPRQAIASAVTDLTMTVNYGARLPPHEALLSEIIVLRMGCPGSRTHWAPRKTSYRFCGCCRSIVNLARRERSIDDVWCICAASSERQKSGSRRGLISHASRASACEIRRCS